MKIREDLQYIVDDTPKARKEWSELRARVEKRMQKGPISGTVEGKQLNQRNIFQFWKTYVDLAIVSLLKIGMQFQRGEPAHLIGHVLRESMQALRMLHHGKYDKYNLLVGAVSMSLHDIGTYFVPRYQEVHRVLRHPEITGLILYKLLYKKIKDHDFLEYVVYSIGAHGHYHARLAEGEPVIVYDEDNNVIGEIPPYVETYMQGDQIKPHLFVWLPRWIDRTENCGDRHFARDYFTCIEEHKDFDGHQFIETGFKAKMRLLLRDEDAIRKDPLKHSIFEWMRMYRDSQIGNSTPYSRFDFGYYVTLKMYNMIGVERILNAGSQFISPYFTDEIFSVWHFNFISPTIEPSDRGKVAALDLYMLAKKLPDQERPTLAKHFFVGMECHCEWYMILEQEIMMIPGYEKLIEFKMLAPYLGESNALEILRPRPEVYNLIAKVRSFKPEKRQKRTQEKKSEEKMERKE